MPPTAEIPSDHLYSCLDSASPPPSNQSKENNPSPKAQKKKKKKPPISQTVIRQFLRCTLRTHWEISIKNGQASRQKTNKGNRSPEGKTKRKSEGGSRMVASVSDKWH